MRFNKKIFLNIFVSLFSFSKLVKGYRNPVRSLELDSCCTNPQKAILFLTLFSQQEVFSHIHVQVLTLTAFPLDTLFSVSIHWINHIIRIIAKTRRKFTYTLKVVETRSISQKPLTIMCFKKFEEKKRVKIIFQLSEHKRLCLCWLQDDIGLWPQLSLLFSNFRTIQLQMTD